MKKILFIISFLLSCSESSKPLETLKTLDETQGLVRVLMFNQSFKDTSIHFKDTIECQEYKQIWDDNIKTDSAYCKVSYNTNLIYSDIELNPSGKLGEIYLTSNGILSTMDSIKLKFPEVNLDSCIPLMIPTEIDDVKVTQRTLVVKEK